MTGPYLIRASEVESTPAGFPHGRIEPLDIGLDLLAAPFVHDLPSHHRPGVGKPVAGRRQRALDVVDAFADHHLDMLGPLVEHHDLDDLPGFGYPYLDLLDVHDSSRYASKLRV